jgi:hypothetical protein
MSRDIAFDADSAPARPAERKKTTRTRAPAELGALARDHTKAAIRVLVDVMRSDAATPAARVSAANAILERGWGKGAQPADPERSAFELLDRIERIIVHPGGAAKES